VNPPMRRGLNVNPETLETIHQKPVCGTNARTQARFVLKIGSFACLKDELTPNLNP
jgi:hypothetical protein